MDDRVKNSDSQLYDPTKYSHAIEPTGQMLGSGLAPGQPSNVSRDSQLTSLADLEKRVELLRKNGVRVYEDGTLKLAIDIQATSSAQAPDTVEDLVKRLNAATGGRFRGL